MSWLSLLSGLLSVAKWFIGFLHDRQITEAEHNRDMLKGLEDAQDAIKKAKDARLAARTTAERDPDGVLRDDDGFKRKD